MTSANTVKLEAPSQRYNDDDIRGQSVFISKHSYETESWSSAGVAAGGQPVLICSPSTAWTLNG